MNGITHTEMDLWTEYVRGICGVVLGESKAYLIESRLAPLAKEYQCTAWSDFYVVACADSSGVIRRKIIDAITTGETSFFRDSVPFDLLKNKLLPEMVDIRSKLKSPESPTTLRIWCAACSTGQEAYSIAMIVRDLFGDTGGYDVRILATDISDRAIATASYGMYSRFDIDRGVPAEQVDRHFRREGDFYRIRDEVRERISFKRLHLLDELRLPQQFDIVLCRNVAIYFGESDRKRLFDGITRHLAQKGALIIGSTETITDLCQQFELKRYLRTIYYQLKNVTGML